MKVLILVCLIFAAGCQGGGFLDSLKQTLKQVGGAFTETFKQVGQQAKAVSNNDKIHLIYFYNFAMGIAYMSGNVNNIITYS
jgi:hypothetical protein